MSTLPLALTSTGNTEIPRRLMPDTMACVLEAWVSVSARNDAEISDGTPIGQAFDRLTAPNVVALGINCTKPEFISGLISHAGASRPLAVYPNAGRTWDAVGRRWLDPGVDRFPKDLLSAWLNAGVRLLGGCCGLGYDHITDVRELLQSRKDGHENAV